MGLNVLLPGAGLFYIGQRVLGLVLAGTFLGCFLAMLSLFLVGYSRYLSLAMSDNLLEGTKLEEAGAALHPAWLLGLTAAGLVLYACSTALFARAKRRLNS